MISPTRIRAWTAIAVGMSTLALGTGIIVPLYIFPGSSPSCSAWAPLINTITANPSTPFFLIVNPDSGPGAAGSQPDATSYQGCIPELKAHSNVKVVGYVPTGDGSRSQSAVDTDVATYAGWSSAYRPDGIFFDEVDPTSNLLPLYTSYSQTARQSFDSGSGFVILNPGANVGSTGYFSIADQIVTAEDFFDDFSASQLTINSNQPAAQQAVILHDAPSTTPSDLISQLVTTDGIGSLYITDDTQANNGNPYDSLPTDLSSFVAAVGADS